MNDQTYTAEQAMKSLQYLAEFAGMCVGEDADKHEKLVAAFIGHFDRRASVPDAVRFAAWLIDHREGETVTEEGLQIWLAEMLDFATKATP